MNKKLSALFAVLSIATAANAQLKVGTPAGAPGSTLQVTGSFAPNYRAITTAGTSAIATNDYYVVYNNNTAAGNLILPASVATMIGRLYTIKNTTASQTLTVTPAGSETIDGNVSITIGANQSAQIVNTGLTGAAATWEVVSFNNATAAGCVPDYFLASRNSSNITNATTGTYIAFNNTLASGGSGITLSGGNFTLTAGNTYSLDASVFIDNYSITNGYIQYEWVNTSTGAVLAGSAAGQALATTYSATNAAGQTRATAIITPASNITVGLRVTASNCTADIRQNNLSYAMVKQLNACTGGSGITTSGGSSVTSVGGGNTTSTAFNVNDLGTTTVPNSTYSFTIPAGGKALFMNYMLGTDETNVPTGGGAAYYKATIYLDGVATGLYLISQEPAQYPSGAQTGGAQLSYTIGGVLSLTAGPHTIDVRMIRTQANGIASGVNQQFTTLSNVFSAGYLN